MGNYGNFKNTGTGKCPLAISAVKRMIFVPRLGDDGTENKIALADVGSKTTWQALFDALNQYDRYYPTPNGQNIESETADPQTEDFNDGSQLVLSDGAITITALFPQEAYRLREAFNSFRGKDIGVYLIDSRGQLMDYNKSDNGDYYPLPVDSKSIFNSKIMLSSDSASSKVDLTFQLRRDIDWADFRVTSNETFDFDFLDELDVYGLDDVEITITNPALTGFDLKVVDFNGSPVTGLTTSDFTLYNTTDSSSITPDSITPVTGSDGNYTVVTPLQVTSKDILFTLTYQRYDKDTETYTTP